MIITGNFNVPGVPPQRSVPDHLVVAIEYIRMQLMGHSAKTGSMRIISP
jgi:hypothetical protein